MAQNVVELRTPQGRESLELLLRTGDDHLPRGYPRCRRQPRPESRRNAGCRSRYATIFPPRNRWSMPMARSSMPISSAGSMTGARWWEGSPPRTAFAAASCLPLLKASPSGSMPAVSTPAGAIATSMKSTSPTLKNGRLCKAAIVIPVHLPFGQILGQQLHQHGPRERGPDGRICRIWCPVRNGDRAVFVAGYVQANRTKRRIPSDCVLSKREVECLRWAAIGKTDKEISMILNRSHATIRYHIHRAGEKLDSVNRAQTIFKAGQLGYLGASD